ncbi:MAG TPA: suppressor of fused domain protein [Jatrophihabitans sp.]
MSSPASDVLAVVEAAYHEHFEVTPARASVSFVGVDQIEILRYSAGAATTYVSLGMSRYPMADPTAAVVDAERAPRAELLLSCREPGEHLWRALAVLAAAPAVEGAVYAAGNRVDLGEPLYAGARCTGGMLTPAQLRPIAVPGMAEVNVLQLLPATPNELAWARVHGSEALIERWSVQAIDLTDLARGSADLG